MNKEMEAARTKAIAAIENAGLRELSPARAYSFGFSDGWNAHASRLAEAERVIDHYARKATWNEAPVVALIPSGTAYGGDELKGYNKAREYRRKYPADETAKGGGK